MAAKRHISERPELVNERKEFGHWEIDTVIGHGSKHCLVTMVERQSRYTFWYDLAELNWDAIASHDFRASEIKEAKQSEFLLEHSFPGIL